ncbi:MAG: M48 family metalloprotease [Actinobacteria bacterium]|nr:M48 family metalloprotease [Actinomycetota bacterium]
MTVAALLGAAIVIPSFLRLGRAVPSLAASIWIAVLLLRALFTILAAISLLALIPGTEAFAAISYWCWNATVPLLGTHLGVSGARLMQAITIMPLLLLSVFGVSRLTQIAKSHRAIRRRLRAVSLGKGPDGSVIVGGAQVMMGAAGLVRPEVVLSAGALTYLDDQELEAGLAHERGHIARRHSWWLAIAEVCGSIARPLPGTRHALGQLKFHLERDADHWAVARTRNPLALASAICKSASSPNPVGAFALSGDGAVARVDQLLAADANPRGSTSARRMLATLVMVLAVACVAIASSVPSAAASGVKHLGAHEPPVHCPL